MDLTFLLTTGYYFVMFFGTFVVFLITGFYWVSYSKYNFRPPKIKKNKKYKCGRFSLYLTILSFIILTLGFAVPSIILNFEISFIEEEKVITEQILKVINFFNKIYNKFFNK